MITYNWTISAVDCKPVVNDLTNVVYTIHWRLGGTDEDGVSAEVYGAVVAPDPNPDTFEPFESLTAEIVSGWVESILNTLPVPDENTGDIQQTVSPLDSYKAIIAEKIYKLKNPEIVTMQLLG
jgi:hypothetical protein